MSSSLRRGALAAAAIAFSIASLAACGAGHNAQSLEIKPDNAATTVGDIQIQNAVVITQPDLESTGPAVVSATFFNNGRTDQTLESITVDGTDKSAELKPAKGQKGADGGLTVPAGGSLILGGEGNASAVLPSSREAVQDGNAQKITFTFSKTGEVGLEAFVVPAESYFSEWGPSDVPAAPGASAKPSQGESGRPSDGETSGAPSDGESATGPEGATGTPSGEADETGAATASEGTGAEAGH
ncbi:copper chaperone PCu(A)C [Streptomyces mutabilis]|uniref:copper chaperone PCu(A)C n=1 Tax=Streptomyces mutabilis TaxID=67332 RepID=UPI00177E2D8A|nr:copper chaperone PCu(A)C [Streptomyces mutabilis]GGQ09462.1 lipoprotein [Streptomyces mutabilis]